MTEAEKELLEIAILQHGVGLDSASAGESVERAGQLAARILFDRLPLMDQIEIAAEIEQAERFDREREAASRFNYARVGRFCVRTLGPVLSKTASGIGVHSR